MNNLHKVYNELKELLGSFDSFGGNPVLIIKDRLGGNHVISELKREDCIRDNHLIFSAYYRDSERPDDKGKSHYSVALPIELYAGIELHADLPKGLRKEHKDVAVGFKFKSN